VKLGAALEHLHRSVDQLADELRATAERHAVQQDVYHMGRTLSARIDELASSLDPFLTAYGQSDGGGDGGEVLHSLAEKVRRGASVAAGRSGTTGMLLLRDLRDLFVQASGVEMDWTIVRQGAMAARDEPLVLAATVGLEETRRVLRWLTTRVKEASPQILMATD
jgi:hypothetical protein